MRTRFARGETLPATVIVIRIAEAYTQCARAVKRADLWARDDSAGLPTPGGIVAEVSQGEEGGPVYEAEWPARAAQTMW